MLFRILATPDSMTLTDAALAAELAKDAGKLLLGVRDELGFLDPRALGAAGDKRANALILERLRDERPEDGVLSEEAHDDLTRLRRPGLDRRPARRHAGILVPRARRLGRPRRAVAGGRRDQRRRRRTARRW